MNRATNGVLRHGKLQGGEVVSQRTGKNCMHWKVLLSLSLSVSLFGLQNQKSHLGSIIVVFRNALLRTQTLHRSLFNPPACNKASALNATTHRASKNSLYCSSYRASFITPTSRVYHQHSSFMAESVGISFSCELCSWSWGPELL